MKIQTPPRGPDLLCAYDWKYRLDHLRSISGKHTHTQQKNKTIQHKSCIGHASDESNVVLLSESSLGFSNMPLSKVPDGAR